MSPQLHQLLMTRKRSWEPLFGIAVLLFSGIVLWGAWNTNRMLRTLVNDYLRNQALFAATTLEQAVHDLGRNPAVWEEEFSTAVGELEIEYSQILLVNSGRRIVFPPKSKENRSQLGEQELDQILKGEKLYIEKIVRNAPRPLYQLFLPFRLDYLAPNPETNATDTLHVLVVVLYLDSADFISRPGRVNLVLVGIASALLLIFWISGRIFLSRYLTLKAREEEQQRWAVLGQMAATLAHEIRNPIGAVKGLAQLLQEEHRDAGRNKTYLDTIVGESQRLEKLVSDLLVFAKPPLPQKCSFNLSVLLEDVNQLFREKLSRQHVVLHYEAGGKSEPLHSDYELLRRVLVNLIENAVQAMPAGGTIKIRQEKGSHGILLVIEDEGEGLGEEIPKVFEPFFTTKASGTGLGLAISQQIVHSLGGTLHLGNRQPKGARATIFLPA